MKKILIVFAISLFIGSAVGQSMNVHTRSGTLAYPLASIDSITFDLTINQAPVMRQISGGTFSMGQTGIAEPIHSVTLSSFYIDTTEVTQADYQMLMGVNPSQFKGDKKPVENVTWFDAALYCNKRSKRDDKDTVYSYTGITGIAGNGCTSLTGLTINYSRNGYRLPTEAEWEYSCRAGTTTKSFWGDDSSASNNYAWTKANGGDSTHTVALKQPNPLKLYDMVGNVFEWCSDFSVAYTSASQVDPTGPTSSTGGRVVRGGSVYWEFSVESCCSAFRRSDFPHNRYNSIGFRCIRR